MPSPANNDKTIFVTGVVIGAVLTIALAGGMVYKESHPDLKNRIKSALTGWPKWDLSIGGRRQIAEQFNHPIDAVAGKSFGKSGQLTFELFRDGTFVIDGQSGYAWQKSESYRDSGFIRSTNKLPKTYKVSVVLGEIDYGLEKIQKLPQDPEYPEGPQNENGSYLIAITDEKPTGHHTNIWWHQHRKLVIDVDNNAMGHGMPDPMFMVYFDSSNRLVSYDGQADEWLREWRKAVTYEPSKWYKVEVEKTKSHFILSVYGRRGDLLKRGKVDLKNVWHEDGFHSDYFVVGDPHENYYQGSMKIDSITFTPT